MVEIVCDVWIVCRIGGDGGGDGCFGHEEESVVFLYGVEEKMLGCRWRWSGGGKD